MKSVKKNIAAEKAGNAMKSINQSEENIVCAM